MYFDRPESEKETIITHADAKLDGGGGGSRRGIYPDNREAARARTTSLSRRLSRSLTAARATLASGKAEGIALGTGAPRFLSTAAAASVSPLLLPHVDGSTGESYRAAYRAILPRGTLPTGTGAHRRRKFALFIGTDGDSFTTPVAVARCGPFAKRVRPISGSLVLRYAAAPPPIGPVRPSASQSPGTLTRGSPIAPARPSPRTNGVTLLAHSSSYERAVELW